MSFDWVTFGFQLFNVIILLAILQYFLFKPVAAVIARRQRETDNALRAAEAAKSEAEAAAANANAEAEANRQARHNVMLEARKEADEQRKTLVDKAREEASRIIAEGEFERSRAEEKGKSRLVEQARDLAVTIALRAISSQPKAIKGYVDRLEVALSALPEAQREALLSGKDLSLVSAAPLSESERKLVLSALAPYGTTPVIAIDPQLISGLELHSDSGAIRNSLAHDLDSISEAMHDEQ